MSKHDEFWAQQAKRLIHWERPFNTVSNCSFNDDISIKWFEDGALNLSYNCLDRHLDNRKDKIAIIWEGDNDSEKRHISYQELHMEVCKFANVLKNNGVSKGDRVVIYMPMIPEAVVAMLASSRIGAVHSVVFGGFSPQSLTERINDSGAKLVITANEGLRGGKTIPLKTNVDQALLKCPNVKRCITIKRTDTKVNWEEGRDVWYHEEMKSVPSDCPPTPVGSEDPLFILYTSGSTGKPKGLVHTTGGYGVYAAYTMECIFAPKEEDIFWCTADVGWITGHTYVTYGPLLLGATIMMFEGIPTYPTVDRWWQIIDRYKVTIFYTAPTAIRSLMKEGDGMAQSNNLRLLGTVGEPINVEAWQWYFNKVGHGKCPIVDTWWQTETGGIMISAQPGFVESIPGSASKPLPGIEPILLDDKANIIEGGGEGALCISTSWPGQARTIWGDHERFKQTYFTTFKGYYFTGDGAKRDKDGNHWITGRMDDVINVSGHRLGTAEIEDAIDCHPRIIESAVVGMPHDIKGQGVYAYVILKNEAQDSNHMLIELNKLLRQHIGPIAAIDHLHIVDALPKTRSGKIMRRILRKIANGEIDQLGDTSTLADPSIVERILESETSANLYD